MPPVGDLRLEPRALVEQLVELRRRAAARARQLLLGELGQLLAALDRRAHHAADDPVRLAERHARGAPAGRRRRWPR